MSRGTFEIHVRYLEDKLEVTLRTTVNATAI